MSNDDVVYQLSHRLVEPDPAIEDRISLGIQTYRMGWADLRFVTESGDPAAQVHAAVEQLERSHCKDDPHGDKRFAIGGKPAAVLKRWYSREMLL